MISKYFVRDNYKIIFVYDKFCIRICCFRCRNIDVIVCWFYVYIKVFCFINICNLEDI